MPASHIFLILWQKRLHIDVDQTMYNSANIWNYQKKSLNLQRKRDAVQPLKFWWIIQKVGAKGWTEQATNIMECTDYLKQQLDAIGWPAWKNEYSNTVFFRRPSDDIVNTYILAEGYDENFGGPLTHVVVMQHVTKEKIDVFINALKAEATAVNTVRANAADDMGEVKKVLSDGQVLIQNGDTYYNTAGTRTK